MVALPTLIPLSEAARKYGLDEARLRELVEKGKIRAGRLPGSDEVLVSEDEVRGEAIQEKGLRKEDLPEYKKHAHLKGRGISLPKAVEKYGLNPSTIFRWYKKGIIAEAGREVDLGGERILYDEADIAYCSEVYRKYGRKGRRVFDKNGLPYKTKPGPLVM
jgi:predicted DNA-binding transcriptional regulator AlpA